LRISFRRRHFLGRQSVLKEKSFRRIIGGSAYSSARDSRSRLQSTTCSTSRASRYRRSGLTTPPLRRGHVARSLDHLFVSAPTHLTIDRDFISSGKPRTRSPTPSARRSFRVARRLLSPPARQESTPSPWARWRRQPKRWCIPIRLVWVFVGDRSKVEQAILDPGWGEVRPLDADGNQAR